MIKKLVILLIIVNCSFYIWSASNNSKVKFLKGNIADKTSAVKEATESDSVWLSNKAIEFALENHEIIGNDRELESLAVAAIYSISQDYVKYANQEQKSELTEQLANLFTEFSQSNSVQMAVLSKVISLKSYLQTEKLSCLLNDYITSININTADAGVFKASLNTLEQIGDNNTFLILYSFLYNPRYSKYKTEIEKAIISLLPSAMNEILSLIQQADMVQMNSIFTLVSNNSNISKNSLCEISENMLSKSIYIIENSSKVSPEYFTIPSAALKILAENKWTRASANAVSYFNISKSLYNAGMMEEQILDNIIYCLSNVAPIDSVSILIAYLEELNSLTEKGSDVSSETVLAIIKTLGAIGDKSAFDSLLAVTYLNYPESVLHASQEALSGLRW